MFRQKVCGTKFECIKDGQLVSRFMGKFNVDSFGPNIKVKIKSTGKDMKLN